MTNNYYILELFPNNRIEANRTDAVQTEGFNVGEAPHCPSCKKAIGSLKWLPPYYVELETWGDNFGDFVFFGSPEQFLVSEHFREIFLKSGQIGLNNFERVEVVKVIRHNNKPKDSPPHYFKVDVARSTTTIDTIASGYEWSDNANICPECLFPRKGELIKWDRIVIKAGSWQGEDIFIPRGGDDIITSAKFKRFCIDNRVRNAVFINADKYSYQN